MTQDVYDLMWGKGVSMCAHIMTVDRRLTEVNEPSVCCCSGSCERMRRSI